MNGSFIKANSVLMKSGLVLFSGRDECLIQTMFLKIIPYIQVFPTGYFKNGYKMW